jgi:RES domain-containing protein
VWVWRLSKASRPAFEGEGARLYGGRWNHPGVAVVYTAESIALAVLEFFVHLDAPDSPDLVVVGAEVPGDLQIRQVDRDSLPPDWHRTPAPASLATLGTAWVQEGATAVLAVPSSIVPRETNYLLNPTHADFARIRIGKPEPFSLDPRMLRKE